MNDPNTSLAAPALDQLRRQKLMFDHTWTLATVLATTLAVVCWYFGLSQVNIVPIIWTMAALALAQQAINLQAQRLSSRAALRATALSSQLLGTLLLGVGWHLFGGLQQPVFPLFIVLPLLPATLLFSFWQQQLALLGLLAVLISGIVLSADTNSFIAQRSGLSVLTNYALPHWIPRSRVAFADVNTSPTYDLVLMITIAVIGIAVSTTGRALITLFRREVDHACSLQGELTNSQELSTRLVTCAPGAQVLVASNTGRIVQVSERFRRLFDLAEGDGQFLLDAVAFAYPLVIKRLIATGGEEIQAATVAGRQVILRIRAEVLGSQPAQAAIISVESCEEICWRAAVDALDEPAFAVNSLGEVVFLNRCALTLFGQGAEGAQATTLFDRATARWWDIAPLDSTRRVLERGEQRYLVTIRRQRIAASVGELCFVQLHERGSVASNAAVPNTA